MTKRLARPEETHFRPSYRRYLGQIIHHKANANWEVVVRKPQDDEAKIHNFNTFELAKEFVRSIAYELYLISATASDGKGAQGKQIALSPRKAATLFARGHVLPIGAKITVDGPEGTCHFAYVGRGRVG